MATNDKKIMKEIVDQYYLGNFQAIIDHATENVKWISHKMANVNLKNKQELINFFENVPKGRFLFENKKFVIDDNTVVVEGVCRYQNKNGALIENFYCDIFSFKDNRIEELSSYFI